MDVATTRQPRRIPQRVRGSRRRGWWPDALSAVAAASVLIVVALWVHGGNVQALFAGGGSALTSIGRLTGLVAADLLLIQVILMARVPWIERTYGQDGSPAGTGSSGSRPSTSCWPTWHSSRWATPPRRTARCCRRRGSS